MAPTRSRRAHRGGRALVAGLAAVAATVASACTWTENDTRAATAGLPDVTEALRSETWVLVPTGSEEPVGPAAPTLVFGDGVVEGRGCDRYEGTFTVDDHTVEIRDLAITERTCDASGQAGDDAFLAAVAGAHEVDVTDRDLLVLLRDDTRLELIAEDR